MAEFLRRSLGEDAIYFDHPGSLPGCAEAPALLRPVARVVSPGFDADGKRIRKKVYGRTKTAVEDKLRDLHEDLSEGIAQSAMYTVQQACADWLQDGLDGRSG